MAFIDRLGIDVGVKLSVEDGLRWAAAHGVRYLDVRLDTGPEAFVAFTPARCAALRAQAESAGVTLGLHTSSAVNIAEVAPFLAARGWRRLKFWPSSFTAVIVIGYELSDTITTLRRTGGERRNHGFQTPLRASLSPKMAHYADSIPKSAIRS